MSDDAVQKTIELVNAQIADLDRQLGEKKRMVNDLCKLAGRPAVYADADLIGSSVSLSTRPDEYYGKPLATVVTMILEKRNAARLGAAAVNEIYDEMVTGGFGFGGKNDDNNKRGLYISLGKNTSTFHKLPNGTYGLLKWYDVKESKSSKGNGKKPTDDNPPLHEELQAEDESEVDEPVVATAKPK
jgi:hypothetical protein